MWFWVLKLFLHAKYFLEVIFFSQKRIRTKKKFCAKQNTRIFFFYTQYLFLDQMPQILKVVENVLWAIS